jgi:Arc/MetJ-type ribon-helix-helix transcriptional regulator
MTIELSIEQELLIARALHSGAYHDAQDVIRAALETLAEGLEERHGQVRPSRLWELRQGLSLGDVSVHELIAEGRE